VCVCVVCAVCVCAEHGVGSDTVCDLGNSAELANYGEYSGAPNEDQTFEYAKTILDLMTRWEGLIKLLQLPDGRAGAGEVGGEGGRVWTVNDGL